jgi:tetratricopeptide (TPR) repeat protein
MKELFSEFSKHPTWMFAPMQSRPKLTLIIAVCVFASAAESVIAETIYLKNGMYIVARNVTEKDGRIEYWIAGSKYSISKNSVVKIDAGNGPTPQPSPNLGAPAVEDLTRHSASAGAVRQEQDRVQLPMLTGPKQDDPYWTALRGRISQGGNIDRAKLTEVEAEQDRRTATNAYFLAGVVEAERGNADGASTYLARAIKLDPENQTLIEWHAIILSKQGRFKDAASELERAAKLKPDSVQVLQLLGMAQYDAGYTSDAVASWSRAERLSPDETTDGLLRKAERELDVERKSREKQSSHFVLRYEGSQTSAELQRELLGALERGYRDLARQFNSEPADNIIVILYTQKEFFDITQAPSWAGALNDGKLRIPIGGVTTTGPELEHVLRHELTHSFLRSLTSSRCPTWLNEGLAQMMEPRNSGMYAQTLGALFQEKKVIPLSALEGSFTRFSEMQAAVAYAESLSAAEYLRDRFGMGEIVRMLQLIGSGSTAEDALHHSTGLDYSGLERRIGERLADLGAK